VYRAEEDAAIAFWTRDLPVLVAEAGRGGPIAEVVAPPSLRDLAVRGPLRSTLSIRVKDRSLLDVALAYDAEGVSADVAEVRAALAAKRRWVRLTDGSVAELSERVAALAGTTAGSMPTEGKVELPIHAFGEARAWAELADSSQLDATTGRWRDHLRALSAHVDPGEVPGLTAILRDYQRTGVAWLQFLTALGVGGILADDMGLGKTVQTLALLSWRAARDGRAPSLVVAPTSVAPNWLRESERFTPGLRGLLLHGSDRHVRYEDVPEHDLVVTTYALLRRDVERLRGIGFRYVVLDEAQHVKNHGAATTAAAKSLRAELRLALTGTPIENRLLELWSILDFCNPGMLGTWRSFVRRYERPVAGALADATASSDGPVSEVDTAPESLALRERIRPFVLRRLKAEVQKDLPPKIESDVVVDLTPAQRRAYAALALAAREDLGQRIADESLASHQMLVLTMLLRLRQMACDPRLIDPRHTAEDSAKLLAFRELVSEVVSAGRRALVFSQFVELLGLVRADLDAQRIEYAYLDGRTRDREAVVRSFVQGTMPLFLLSLRAGGTGLNLAAADVVIHLDPWWNPAVEDQATDRAHRIGQSRTVSVYRIVAAGTIEEAILRMKQRKRALASAFVEDDDATAVKRLTREEVAELMRFDG
jgi:SNF2 family DNA or RNA helicase